MPQMYTEDPKGRLVPLRDGQVLPRVFHSLEDGVGRPARPGHDHCGRIGSAQIDPHGSQTTLAGPSRASTNTRSESKLDRVVPTKPQPTISGKSVVGGNARFKKGYNVGVQDAAVDLQRRQSVVLPERDESILSERPSEASCHANADDVARRMSMEDAETARPVPQADLTRQAWRGSETPTSTPSRRKRIRNVPYKDCTVRVQAQRDSIIQNIKTCWPRAHTFWPQQLAPTSSNPLMVGPLNPQDVSGSLLANMLRLASVTLDEHERAFAAMLKAVKMRARKEKAEAKLLLVDADEAFKVCATRARAERQAELRGAVTAQTGYTLAAGVAGRSRAGSPVSLNHMVSDRTQFPRTGSSVAIAAGDLSTAALNVEGNGSAQLMSGWIDQAIAAGMEVTLGIKCS